MFEGLPYHLVNILDVSSLVNSYIQWIMMVKQIGKWYIIMMLHYFVCVGARVSVVVGVSLTQSITL